MPSLTIVDTIPKRRRVALYCRVSSDEQAEKETIQDQVYRLRLLCQLEQLEIIDEYLDDGVSGVIPFAKRPEGGRLLRDAAAGTFDTVLFLKVNRLARKSLIALELNEQLERLGVSIKSATENIDTRESLGQLIFQMLGAFSEFDRKSILESTTRGRARGARNGRWYGVVPIGYTLREHRLVENGAPILPGLSEADLVRDIFRRIANGSTGMREAMRLSGLGLRPFKRYVNSKTGLTKETTYTEEWRVERITRMIRSTIYRGEQTYKGKYGDQVRVVPALVTEDLWTRANRQLTRNRTLSSRNTRHQYLLAGVIRCGVCGFGYMGTFDNKSQRAYYQCSHLQSVPNTSGDGVLRHRCNGKAVPADNLEQAIWADCVELIEHPDDTITLLTERHRDRHQEAVTAGNQREALRLALGNKDGERQRVITMRRRDQISDSDFEAQIRDLDREKHALQAELAALDALVAQADVDTKQAQGVLSLLDELRSTVARGYTFESQRAIVRELVQSITVLTEGSGRHKTGRLKVIYKFGARTGPTDVGDSPTACSTSDTYMTLARDRDLAQAAVSGSAGGSAGGGLGGATRQPSANSSART